MFRSLFSISLCSLTVFLVSSVGASDAERQKQREKLIQKIRASQVPCEESNRPCKLFLSPSSKETEAINAYQESVIAKINRVGQENFPIDIVPLGEDETVIFTVEITRDGLIWSTALNTRSRFDKINDYALTILDKAGPFQRFEGVFPKEIDIVVITRSMRFSNLHNVQNTE